MIKRADFFGILAQVVLGIVVIKYQPNFRPRPKAQALILSSNRFDNSFTRKNQDATVELHVGLFIVNPFNF